MEKISVMPAPPELPAWFQPAPFDYQAAGIARAAAGHTLIADEPGLGKTLQAIGTAVVKDASRVIVVCPPILAANWHREIRRAHAHAPKPPAVATITAADKTATVPADGWVIVPDSMLVARPSLVAELTDWRADMLIIDEAHRMKNPKAKRTRAAARIAATSDATLALTGTPIINTPLDVLPLLSMLGKLTWFPGGRVSTFIERYTYEAPWGGRVARKKKLPELHSLLDQFVWTRRTKAQVLADLPAKLRTTMTVRPGGRELAAAHADLDGKIDRFLAGWDRTDEALDDWCADNLRHIAQLRRAAGMAKIEAATSFALDHVEGAPGRPLIVWAIHRDVIDAIAATLADNNLRVDVIHGDVPGPDRDRIVADFQAGRVQVLVGQIVAAGVGLTLTASSDVLFAETDWTPANVVQAEDRVHRIGQTLPVQITTLIADGTLDGRIHGILADAIGVLDELTPGSDHAVAATTAGGAPAKEILRQLVAARDRHAHKEVA